MPSDPPIEPPVEATAASDALAEPALVTVAEPAEAAEPAAPAPPAAPAAPVSPAKEWAVAIAIMIVFALICLQFVSFLQSNRYGGPGP